MRVRLLIIAITLFLSGCTTYQKTSDNWPAELPPMAVFLSAYDADMENQTTQSLENYLTWVKRFYQGWIVYDRGWLKMTSEMKAKINDPSKRRLAEEKISAIGLMISPEWAKDKDGRYIKTSAVSTWGESLLEALDRGIVLELMDSVMLDIERLKQGQLNLDEINIERYFPDLAEDPDDSFFF